MAACAVPCLSVHSSVVWGGGVCREDSGLHVCQHRSEGRRGFGGSLGLCFWERGVQGPGGLVVGGLSLVVVPLPYLLHTPCKAGFLPSTATSGAGEEGGDGRLGQGGGVGERRRRRREGELEAGRARGPQMLATPEQKPGTQSFLLPAQGSESSRGLFAGPGCGLSSGPTEDDVDLSVLHALGRSGCFSWDDAPPLLTPLCLG